MELYNQHAQIKYVIIRDGRPYLARAGRLSKSVVWSREIFRTPGANFAEAFDWPLSESTGRTF
jgi:hypothetical protein